MNDIIEAIGEGVLESLTSILPACWGKSEGAFRDEYFGSIRTPDGHISIRVDCPDSGKPVAKIFGLPAPLKSKLEAQQPYVVFRYFI